MTPPSDTDHKIRRSYSEQAATWLTPEQIDWSRGAYLTDAFSHYLHGRNKTIVTLSTK